MGNRWHVIKKNNERAYLNCHKWVLNSATISCYLRAACVFPQLLCACVNDCVITAVVILYLPSETLTGPHRRKHRSALNACEKSKGEQLVVYSHWLGYDLHSRSYTTPTHRHTFAHRMAVFPWWICWCDIFSPLCGEGYHGDALVWRGVCTCTHVYLLHHLKTHHLWFVWCL